MAIYINGSLHLLIAKLIIFLCSNKNFSEKKEKKDCNGLEMPVTIPFFRRVYLSKNRCNLNLFNLITMWVLLSADYFVSNTALSLSMKSSAFCLVMQRGGSRRKRLVPAQPVKQCWS